MIKVLFLDLYDYRSIYEVALCLFSKIFMYSYILLGKVLFKTRGILILKFNFIDEKTLFCFFFSASK